jgi:hypothetical protein
MHCIVTDGEPFEVEKIPEKVDLNLFIQGKTVKEVVSFGFSRDSFFFSSGFDEDFENDYGKILVSSLSNDLRLKTCGFLFEAFDAFSKRFLRRNAWKAFHGFSRDEYFCVRKVCAANVFKFVKVLEIRMHGAVVDAFQRFMVDKNLLVVQAAYSALGIMSYMLSEMDDRVVHWMENLSCSDLNQACDLAYYLPAIYRKFPSHRPSLLKVFRSLLKNPQSSVRSKAASTLSFFLKNTENPCDFFLSTYQNLLKDTDIVKVEAISNLGIFLEKIPESLQSSFLGTFRRIQTYNLNWRVNLKLAKSLINIAKNLKIDFWMQELWQVSLALCHDRSEVVRVKSGKSLGKIIKDLWNLNEDWDAVIKKDLESLIGSPCYKDRQVAGYLFAVCHDIGWFAQRLERLLNDPVVDVRIVLAKVAEKFKISSLQEKLLNDSSTVVKEIAGKSGIIDKGTESFDDFCKFREIIEDDWEEVCSEDLFN